MFSRGEDHLPVLKLYDHTDSDLMLCGNVQ